jgi:virginiamycin B lyase
MRHFWSLLALALALLGGTLPRQPVSATTTVVEYPIPTGNSGPLGIVAGPDGAVWFSESYANKIGRITTNGTLTEYPIPTPGGQPGTLIVGPDGNFWFAEWLSGVNVLEKMTPQATFTAYTYPIPQNDWLVTGPDGNFWYLDSNAVGRMNLSFDVTTFPFPSQVSSGVFPTYQLGPLLMGSDGAFWFSAINPSGNTPEFVRMTLGGTFSTYPLPVSPSYPQVVGPDGNFWFLEAPYGYTVSASIGRMTPSGSFTNFPFGFIVDCTIGDGMAVGSDGALWMTNTASATYGLVRVTTSGQVSQIAVPNTIGMPYSLTSGPDGNIWFTLNLGNEIGEAIIAPQSQAKVFLPEVASSP